MAASLLVLVVSKTRVTNWRMRIGPRNAVGAVLERLNRRTLLCKGLLQLRTIVLPLPHPPLSQCTNPRACSPFDEHPRTEDWCATLDDDERIAATVPHASSPNPPSAAEHIRTSTLLPTGPAHGTTNDGTHGLWVHSAQGGQRPLQNSLPRGGQHCAQAVPQSSHYTRR